MKRILKSLVLMLGMLMLPTVAYAQNMYADVNGDLEVNIADINAVIGVILSDVSNPSADVNGDGEVNIADINAVIDIILNGGTFEEPSAPTEMEQYISQWTTDEEEATEIVYSEADSLENEELIHEVLNLYRPQDSDENEMMLLKARAESEDDLIQEAIRDNGKNRFNGSIEILQQEWNSGDWGKTHYGGFDIFWNTHVDKGKRCLMVIFYHKGGFPNSKTCYLKLGQVNSGKIIGNSKISIPAGREYACLHVPFDGKLVDGVDSDNKQNILGDHGFAAIFPLVITNDSKARNYLNPIILKTVPMLEEDWRTKHYGDEFGTINGVSVYYNHEGDNEGSGTYQCTELCARYYGLAHYRHAKYWPQDLADKGYLVYKNDGSHQVRESDLIVWQHGSCGHIGVVIKTGKSNNGQEFISVAHQNGGDGQYADPIGTTLKVVDGVIKDIKPGTTNTSPIFKTPQVISHFIRVNNSNEDERSYARSMVASVTNLPFGKREIGSSRTRTFTITNSGYSQLTISSMSPFKGEAFSIDVSSCTLNPNETREFHVTFSPTSAGEYEDRIIIRSNAEDNPRWLIKLSGIGKESENPNGRQLMLSKNVHGTEYRLYKQITDENDTRINPDGSIYYRTQLTLDVIESSNTKTYIVDSDVYHDPQHGGQQPAMLFDLISNQLHIFYNSKVEGNNYKLNGYNYVTSLSDINFNKETVFNGYNWGWFPYYEYNNGQIIIHHFSYAGYYAMKSARNSDGSWSNTRMNSISPQAFAQMWEQTEHALVIEPEVPDTQHDYVDLGLPSGTLWATCNVGASAPEEYGDYFAWGEITPKNIYDWSTYKWCNGSENSITKYCTNSEYGYNGFRDGKKQLDLEDDAAYVYWGSHWRIPTEDQLDELIDECTWTWTTQNGINGRMVTKMRLVPGRSIGPPRSTIVNPTKSSS